MSLILAVVVSTTASGMALICASIILSKRLVQFCVQNVPSTFHRLWAVADMRCLLMLPDKNTFDKSLNVLLWPCAQWLKEPWERCGSVRTCLPQYKVSTYGHFNYKRLFWANSVLELASTQILVHRYNPDSFVRECETRWHCWCIVTQCNTILFKRCVSCFQTALYVNN